MSQKQFFSLRRPSHFLGSLVLILLSGATTGGLYAQAPAPLESPVQVSSYTTGDQIDPHVEPLSDGRFLVVWESDGSPGADLGSGIRGRFLSSEGTFLGPEMELNGAVEGNQTGPRAAAMPNGQFVVGWTGPDGGDIPEDDQGVFVRIFEADGTPIGLELQANTLTASNQIFGDIAVAPDGDFVVVWHGEGSLGDDLDGMVQGRRFNSNGVVQGDQFQINAQTTFPQVDPRVVRQPSGGFVVAWRTNDEIWGRRVDSVGQPLGDDFLVYEANPTIGAPLTPDLAVASDGRFMVTWHRLLTNALNTTEARHYDASGMPLGEAFRLEDIVENVSHRVPTVQATADDGFLVVWSTRDPTPPRTETIKSRAIAADGSLSDTIFRFHETVEDHFVVNLIAAVGANNRMVTSWTIESDVPEMPEGTLEFTTYAQGFELGLFVDGFELGTTDAWSDAVP